MGLNLLKAHILELEECLLKPEIRESPVELDKLLADDWFEVGSYGNVWYKKDCENGLKSFKMTINDFKLHPLSNDVVLATYHLTDETRMIHTMRSSIWKLTNGCWQMFYHQSTIIHNH
ncbi:DUF4440 domain-containing protein [Brevibacillus ginsengisoli]|uniref:nuclear transport factor 2 family protein n=1 Tax=Brevibacillus ginsengisoli TaxID=363854 RepID=UPI003CEF8CE9